MDTDEKQNNAGRRKRPCLRAVAALLLLGCAVLLFRVFYPAKTQDEEASATGMENVPAVVIRTVGMETLCVEQRYVGRVEAVQTVNIRPQVSGEIAGVHFAEGSIVKAGGLLFTLDPIQYDAAVQLRKAELAKAEANCSQAARYYARMKGAGSRAVSEAEKDQAESAVLQSRADVDNTKAALRIAQIDLRHTKITAPITGRIGEVKFTKGNYVTPQDNILANITQTDPIRISFSLPDQEYIKWQRSMKAKKQEYTALIMLADGSRYPYPAEWDFQSNRMDSRTGTILTYLKVKNINSLLVPGGMVSVVLSPLTAQKTVTVPNTAVITDEKGDFVYVVCDGNIARQRYVSLGEQTDTSVAVTAGLKKDEKIVAEGAQSVRQGEKVSPVQPDTGSEGKN
ncbi:MAG: efflux RND transporter periplasmic adaptor subunit [Synergistaceae bacterium]|nr:efflux RND transporter periplasmic adaptor subunit [Synergistaceae bacterium]